MKKQNTFTAGANMAAQRSLLRALGWTDGEIAKPDRKSVV